MTAILIIGFFEALFLAGLIFSKKGKNTSDIYLAITLLVMGFTIIASYIEQYNFHHNFKYPFFIHVAPPLIFLHGPLLWLYIKSLTKPKYRFRAAYLIHFVPFVFIFSVVFLKSYILPTEQRIDDITNELFKDSFLYPLVVVGIALVTQGYMFWGLLIIRNYRRKIYRIYSRVDEIDLRWLRFLLISAIIAYAVNSGIFLIDLATGFLPYEVLQLFSFVVGSLFIFVLGFYGIRQTSIFKSSQDVGTDNFVEIKGLSKNIEPDKDQEFIQKLLDYFDHQKPYLQSDLTIAGLSDKLNEPVEYISYVLNRKLHHNFFDFVNQYRIEEFKHRCLQDEHKKLSIVGVAFESGFNSKATFNRVFKNLTNTTPSQWLTSVSKS